MANDVVRVSQVAIEFAFPYVAPNPTTVTGAGFSQLAPEAAFASSLAAAEVGQLVPEVAVALPTAPPVHVTQDVVEVAFPRFGP